MRQVDVVKLDLSTGKTQKAIDYVAEDVPFQIFVDANYAFVLWCSPIQLKELATGYLLSENILKSVEEIEELTLKESEYTCQIKLKADANVEERIKFSRRHARFNPLITVSPSSYPRKEKIPAVESKLTVKAQVIHACINDMNNRAVGFKQTGALHGSAIYTANGTLVAFAEDVSRHNTVDKVIGMAALNKVDFGSCLLAITGRVPSDLIFKAAKVGLHIFASVAAVLSSGITAAEKANIALVGFVRENRMNIYTGAERIIM